MILQKNEVTAFLSRVVGRVNHALSTLQFRVAGSGATSVPHTVAEKWIYTSILQQYLHTLSTSNAVENFRESDYLFQNTTIALLNRSPVGEKKVGIFHLPTLALRNLFPILWSVPIALATSSTSAPVASHRALIELMLLILWARKALAACK